MDTTHSSEVLHFPPGRALHGFFVLPAKVSHAPTPSQKSSHGVPTSGSRQQKRGAPHEACGDSCGGQMAPHSLSAREHQLWTPMLQSHASQQPVNMYCSPPQPPFPPRAAVPPAGASPIFAIGRVAATARRRPNQERQHGEAQRPQAKPHGSRLARGKRRRGVPSAS